MSCRGLYKEAKSHSPPPGTLLVASHHDSRNQSSTKIHIWGISSLDCGLGEEGYDMTLGGRRKKKGWGARRA